MYTIKEKNKIYNDLKNQDFGEADLQLLIKVWPSHLLAKRAKRNPERYAHEVLYALLGKVSREYIRNNRRKYVIQKEKEYEIFNSTGGRNPDEGGDDPHVTTDATQSNSESTDGKDTGSDELSSDANATGQEKNIVVELEESKTNAISGELDIQDTQAAHHATTDATQSDSESTNGNATGSDELSSDANASEQEKKSPDPAQEPEVQKIKKRKNIPTSTGETSQTETSN